MNKKIKSNHMKLTSLDELLDKHYGKIGTKKRTKFEIGSNLFAIGAIVKDQRILQSMSKKQLAEKTGISKSVISKIEKEQIDIKISTLFKLLEFGLGQRVTILFN